MGNTTVRPENPFYSEGGRMPSTILQTKEGTEAAILRAMAEKSNLIFGCSIDFVMSCK